MTVLRKRPGDIRSRRQQASEEVALAGGNVDLRLKHQKLKTLDEAIKSDSSDEILGVMVRYSTDGPVMGVEPAYKEAGRGSEEAAKFIDRPEVVVSLGNLDATSDPITLKTVTSGLSA